MNLYIVGVPWKGGGRPKEGQESKAYALLLQEIFEIIKYSEKANPEQSGGAKPRGYLDRQHCS